MKSALRLVTTVIAVAFVSTAVAKPAPSSPLDEDAALTLLQRTLKRDGVYDKRISLDCVEYGTEETTNSYFEFVLREIHNAKCGGDPETSHVLDRYRVYRRSGKIEQYEAAEDEWHAYKGAATK
ncbi:MAG TPA: hypothetical protein VIW07_08775 [Candidatus Udaeobacter sp.]|jgi:hypothetical protein